MLKVLKSGFFTSIQDHGRFGYRDIGVPVSGVMDYSTVRKLNMMLENKKDMAVLEITMTGPTLLFEEDTHIAIGGAEMSATLNNQPISNLKVYKIAAGDILSYGRLENGFRSYLAIKHGFTTTSMLGSRSMYFPVTPSNHLSDRAEVPYQADSNFKPKISEFKIEDHLDEQVLMVHHGPEYSMLEDHQMEKLFFKEFTISKENNRMAYQLNEPIGGHNTSMLTSATLTGTVQLTPLGKLIILMKDGQTTGGYPRILQLSDLAVSILAQKKYGDSISFKLS